MRNRERFKEGKNIGTQTQEVPGFIQWARKEPYRGLDHYASAFDG